MIEIKCTAVYGWEAAIRGMRNPMNSWDKSDSILYENGYLGCDDCPKRWEDCSKLIPTNNGCFELGENDFCSRGERKEDIQNLKKSYKY